MCNMTIDGATLSVTSGRLSGSLVSPGEVRAPTYCWYLLRAPPGHRVEIQIHRLVHVGVYVNSTTCRGGYVEVSDGRSMSVGGRGTSVGVEGVDGVTSLKICGEDERLHPPIVIYSDTGVATIVYRVNQQWGSPRFIAYYNFPHKSHPDTGVHHHGGTRLQYTACDWLYQDVHCTTTTTTTTSTTSSSRCLLSSPGYPGIYPSGVRCKYLLAMSSPDVTGTLAFLTVDLHPQRCSTDYIAVYAGTSTSSPS
ncbi:uncharacterized protein LOC135095800 isoform X2 [Scylla paramamosain]